MKRTTFALLSVALLALTLMACNGKAREAETYSANISPYNHTGDYIEVYLDGGYGGGSYPYGGGGSFVCCVSYPAHWRPELSMTVKWATSSGDPSDKSPASKTQSWHEKVVPIEKYDTPGSRLNVHFLPNGEVRLVISNMGAGAEKYPGPAYPVKPPGWKW